MRQEATTHYFIFFTMIIGLLLTIFPLPASIAWLQPEWITLLLIAWEIITPDALSIAIVWMIGLLLDVLEGTLLGEHALALTIICYLAFHMANRLRMFPLLQQSVCVFLLILFYQFILFCIQGFIGNLPHSGYYWVSSLTSVLIWPWMLQLLQNTRRHLNPNVNIS